MFLENHLTIKGIQAITSSNSQVAKEQKISDIAYTAAEKLIQHMGWDRNEIKVLILVSQTSDYLIPSTASLLQKRLMVGQDCIVYDMNLGGSGFPIALQVCGSLLESFSGIRRGLLLFGDIHQKDKHQAAAAIAVEYSESEQIQTDNHSEPEAFCSVLQEKKYTATKYQEQLYEEKLRRLLDFEILNHYDKESLSKQVLFTNESIVENLYGHVFKETIRENSEIADKSNSAYIPFLLAQNYKPKKAGYVAIATGAGLSAAIAFFSLTESVVCNIDTSDEVYNDLK